MDWPQDQCQPKQSPKEMAVVLKGHLRLRLPIPETADRPLQAMLSVRLKKLAECQQISQAGPQQEIKKPVSYMLRPFFLVVRGDV